MNQTLISITERFDKEAGGDPEVIQQRLEDFLAATLGQDRSFDAEIAATLQAKMRIIRLFHESKFEEEGSQKA